MRSLADVLKQASWSVSGSDQLQRSPYGQANDRRNGHPIGEDIELIIASLAIPDDHPELMDARRRSIPILSYPEALGCLSAQFRTLAVAGTHGKSTTTAMLTEILAHGGLDPTSIFGAQPLGQLHGGRLGAGPWLAIEACEFRRSMLELEFEAAALLNIEHDHFDCYPNFVQVVEAFEQFAENVPPHGLLVIPDSSATSDRVARACLGRVETFGFGPASDWRALDPEQRAGRYSFAISVHGRSLGRVRLSVPGEHNVLNALAAAALARYAGCDWSAISGGLERFRGLHRRLEVVRDDDQLVVVDDYAHHPTELHAALSTVRRMYPDRRLWCVFQPHQASRTARLRHRLASSLQNADKVLVANVFRAREPEALPGEVTARDLAESAAELGGDAIMLHDPVAIAEHLGREIAQGDVLVTVGAGDIGKIAHGFGKRI
jgi:UDP-N-acetylmuramate--alanine ligase